MKKIFKILIIEKIVLKMQQFINILFNILLLKLSGYLPWKLDEQAENRRQLQILSI